MSLTIKKLDWGPDLQPVQPLTNPPDPADLVKCIKTLLREEKVEVVRHDSACLSRRELNGALGSLMVTDPKGFDVLVFTERVSPYLRTVNPDYPHYKASEVARMKSVTRRTILRWKARALRTLVAELIKVQ